MDSESEKVVQEALDKIMKDSKLITIVVAHRLSTIRSADKIAYVDKGKVREIGSYEELMAKPNGLYKRLEALQTLDDRIRLNSILGTKIVYGSIVQTVPIRHSAQGIDREKTRLKGGEKIDEVLAKRYTRKAKQLAKDEFPFLIYGGIGALLNGFT